MTTRTTLVGARRIPADSPAETITEPTVCSVGGYEEPIYL
jgi:hypothetical protein